MDLPSILLIIVIGVVAYFHWLQGLLSGLISAVLAVCAACIAFAYYEPMANMLAGGKFNDSAHGVCLLALFALSYLILRVIFDSLIPGNIRVPVLADQIGGAALGVIAGMFAAGVVMVACQYFPFGPSLGGYSRYALNKDKEVRNIESGIVQQKIDRTMYGELKNADLDAGVEHLIIPVDDLVVGMVGHLSDGGTLDNGKPFKSIHPNLLQELFGQRIGIQTGAKHTANNKKGDQVRIEALYTIPKLAKFTAELKEIRPEEKGFISSTVDKQLLAVTIMFTVDAADELDGDRFVRLGPGAVRLVAKVNDEWKNYFPIGTVQRDQAWLNKPDDFLFFKVSGEDRGAHFLFEVDRSIVKTDKSRTISRDDLFVEVKRMVRFELKGMQIADKMPPIAKKYFPHRKVKLYDEANDKTVEVATGTKTPKPPENADNPPNKPENPDPPPEKPTPPDKPMPAENGWDEATLEKPVLTAGDKLPVGIAIGTADADALVDNAAISASVEAKKFATLETKLADTGSALANLPKGVNPIQQLAVPKGMRMIQVKLTPKKTGDAWTWTSAVGEYTVFDGTTAYKPRGVIAEITQPPAVKKLLVKFDSTQDLGGVEASRGTVSYVTFIYVIPSAAKAKEIQYQGKPGGLPLEK